MKKMRKEYLVREGRFRELDSKNGITYVSEDSVVFRVYPKDIYVSNHKTNDEHLKSKNSKKSKRGRVKIFSFGSTKRLRFLLRNVIDKMVCEVGLTYPVTFPNSGLIIKQHFHLLRMRLNYYGYRNVWILEFQERGAPHFHMLLDKEISKEVLAKMWFDVVGSGDSKHLEHGVHVGLIRNRDKMASYFSSYLTKQDQKHVPADFQNVGRFWGVSRDLLKCTEKIFYGDANDVDYIKKQMRLMRRWYKGQKRLWSKNKKFVPDKRFLKYKKRGFEWVEGKKGFFVKPFDSYKIINTNLFVNELKRRGIDTSLYEM